MPYGMLDLVFPEENERELMLMAKRLGFQRLLLCYRFKDPLLKERKARLPKDPALETVFCVLVQSQAQVDQARSVTPEIVARGEPWAFEDKRIRYVIDFESGKRQDFIHHRNSGLNQVFIANAMRTGATLLVNARQLFGDRPEAVLGRMMQNNEFFRKYRPSVVAVSGAADPLQMRAPRDLANLLQL